MFLHQERTYKSVIFFSVTIVTRTRRIVLTFIATTIQTDDERSFIRLMAFQLYSPHRFSTLLSLYLRISDTRGT